MGRFIVCVRKNIKEEKIIRKAKEFFKSSNSNIYTMHTTALSILIK